MLPPPGAPGVDCIGFFLGSSQREISQGINASVSGRYAGDAHIKQFTRADLARSDSAGYASRIPHFSCYIFHS